MKKNSGSETPEDIQAMTAGFNENIITVNNKKCDSFGFGDAEPVNEIAFDVKVAAMKFIKKIGESSHSKEFIFRGTCRILYKKFE